MKRRDSVFALMALGVWPVVAGAQAVQHARVGWLSANRPGLFTLLAPTQSALRELGWVEGRNLTMDLRFAEGRMERLPDLAAELVRLKVHVIVVSNDSELEIVRHASRKIPIVVTSSTNDPVRAGFASSLAHPTGNVTGLMWADPEFSAKSMQLLKELIPTLRRVGNIYLAGLPNVEPYLEAAEAAGRKLGVNYIRLPVRTVADIDAALERARKDRIDALRITDAGLVSAEEARILNFASSNLLPTSYVSPGPVDRGALISYAPNQLNRASRVAAFVDRILKGAKPGELPFEYPTRYDLVINLKTAKRLGITVPQGLLLRADRVIE